ncbi:MAG: hypothetical protein AAGF99_11460 [Bacteroidota bacterium]
MPLSRPLLARLLAGCVVLLGVVPGLAAQQSSTADAFREVVLTGDDVPLLLGTNPNRIAAFAYNGGWTPIPVQVDERERLDLGVAFDGRAAIRCDDPDVSFCFEDGGTGVTVLEYTGTAATGLETLIGPDSNPRFDADDEVVFMARFAGAVAPPDAAPDGADAETRTSVRVGEEASPRYVYLFAIPRGTAVPRSNERLVEMDVSLLNGVFPDAYDFRGVAVSGIESGDDLGSNPETTVVETAHYQMRIRDRWIHDELRIKQNGRLGPDLLDRFKVLLELGSCARNEWTASANRGTLVALRVGPVRAIRVVRGFNSGPLTTGTYTFYERHTTFAIDLRVHPIPGVVEFIDYSDAALGMRYLDALSGNASLTLDGEPDALDTEALSSEALFWQAVTGAPGSLVHAFALDTEWDEAPFERFWDEGQDLRQCTGDDRSIGASGVIVPSRVPATDPRRGTGEYVDLQATRAIYYSASTVTASEAEALATALVPSVERAITEGSIGTERQGGGAQIETLFPTLVRAGAAKAEIALFEANPYDVAVYNALGQRVFAQRVAPDSPTRITLTLPLGDLPAGPYWLQVRSEVSGFGVSERLTVVR